MGDGFEVAVQHRAAGLGRSQAQGDGFPGPESVHGGYKAGSVGQGARLLALEFGLQSVTRQVHAGQETVGRAQWCPAVALNEEATHTHAQWARCVA